jgi:hypothetical protein
MSVHNIHCTFKHPVRPLQHRILSNHELWSIVRLVQWQPSDLTLQCLEIAPVLIQFSLSENNFQQYSVLGCIGVKKCNRLPSAVKNYSHVLPYFPIKTMNGTIINNYQVIIYHWLIEFVCWNLYLIKNKNCKTSFHLFILWMGIPFIAHISWGALRIILP